METFQNNNYQVRLPSGLFSGNVELSRDGREYLIFKAIPYGSISERFAEAKLADSFPNLKGSLPVCPQFDYTPDGVRTQGDEFKSLTLNISIPLWAAEPLPIIVYYHGGGYTRGNGYMYNPKFFMDEPAIFISINYRLGVFGFLSTGDSVIPGNNGLKDCRLALTWVQKYINYFGGDKSKVTIFGDSTGGSIVHLLLLSESANGLFHRAIGSSGNALAGWSFHPNPKENAVELVKYLRSKKGEAIATDFSSEFILNYLRSLPLNELNEAQALFKTAWPKGSTPMYFGPVKEAETSSSFLSKSPYELTLNQSTTVPMLMGITEDEGAFRAGHVLSEETLLTQLNTNWDQVIAEVMMFEGWIDPKNIKEIGEKVRQFYFEGEKVSEKNRDKLSDFFSDCICDHAIYKSCVEFAKWSGAKVYLYEYAYHGPACYMALGWDCPEIERKKVGHADDLLLLFEIEKFIPKGGKCLLKADSDHERFSRNFVKLCTSFAINGEPSYSFGNCRDSKWTAVSEAEGKSGEAMSWYRISENPEMVEIPEDFQKRMRFWDGLYKEYFEHFLIN